MKNVYEECPKFENERWLLRLVEKSDVDDLIKVYGDKNALPFFNSDNCDGDNFYYPTMNKMEAAINFWIQSYETKWFVRWTIYDKSISKAIGTIEMFHRPSEDHFNHMGVIRLDLRSDYERASIIQEILTLIIPPAYELFECTEIITKVPLYAVERIEAVSNLGFIKSKYYMIGNEDHYAYNGYWTIKK